MHRINFTSAATFNANLFHGSLNSPKIKIESENQIEILFSINKNDLKNSRAGLI